jgi:hypothetical protein
MKMNTSDFRSAIINHSVAIGLRPNSTGYLSTVEENLIGKFDNWSEITTELENGNGNELHGKFRAVHSSTALCVNNFAPFKHRKDSFSFLGHSDFSEATFEKKLSTGISTPNLDFYLQNELTTIGIESKFIETIDKKLPNINLDKYLDRKELSYLPQGFSDVLRHYIGCQEKMHLDVAQLIKHSIGLINRSQCKNDEPNRTPVLVYLYWLPTNWSNVQLFLDHEAEIKDFQEQIRSFVQFVPMSYLELWEQYEKDQTFGQYIGQVKARYGMVI